MPLVGIPSMMVANTIGLPPVTPFSPDQLSGLKIWLKADQITANDGDPIGTWSDQSGNAFDYSQATGANKPIYKVNIVNGLPILRFDGVNDELTCAIAGAKAIFNNVGTGVIFVVCSDTNNAGGDAIHTAFVFSTNTTNRRISVITKGTLTSTTRRLDADSDSNSSGTFASGFHVYTSDQNWTGNANTLYIDGTAATPATYSSGGGNTSATDSATLSIGVSTASLFHFPGDIAEFIVYQPGLSSTDRAQVESYLKTKYATP